MLVIKAASVRGGEHVTSEDVNSLTATHRQSSAVCCGSINDCDIYDLVESITVAQLVLTEFPVIEICLHTEEKVKRPNRCRKQQ